jgi:hypothetical protein
MGVCLVYSRDTRGGFSAVAGLTDEDLWLGGGLASIYRLQGDALQDYGTYCNRYVPSEGSLSEEIVTALLLGPTADDVVAVESNFVQSLTGLVYGQFMKIVQWNGTTWVFKGQPTFPTRGPWRSPTGTTWIGTQYGRLMKAPSGMYFRDDFVEVDNPVSRSAQITAVWGESDDHLFVGTHLGAMYEMKGTTWTDIPVAPGASLPFQGGGIVALSGTVGGKVWAATSSGIIQVSATGRSLAKEGNYFAVSAVSDTDVWASGAGGLISHYDGTAWTDTKFTWNLKGDAPTLVGLRASAKQVVAVGTQWTILRVAR